MTIDIPKRKLWILKEDGSAMPLLRFQTMMDLDNESGWSRQVPKYKPRVKVKAGYAIKH